DIFFGVFHGEHHHLDFGPVLFYPLTNFLSTHHGHVQIDKCDVGWRFLDHSDKFFAVRCLTYFPDAPERLNQANESLAEEHVIIRQVNPDFRRTLHVTSVRQTYCTSSLLIDTSSGRRNRAMLPSGSPSLVNSAPIISARLRMLLRPSPAD